MKVFVLHHSYEPEPDVDEVKLIGVYSSRGAVGAAIERLSARPGFRDVPSGFEADCYTVDMDHWTDGFVRLLPDGSEVPLSPERREQLPLASGAFESWPLHDAVLETVQLDWRARTCEISLRAFLVAGLPAKRCAIVATGVRGLRLPHHAPWGDSSFVNTHRLDADGRFVIEMQSGDVLELEADACSLVDSSAASREGSG